MKRCDECNSTGRRSTRVSTICMDCAGWGDHCSSCNSEGVTREQVDEYCSCEHGRRRRRRDIAEGTTLTGTR